MTATLSPPPASPPPAPPPAVRSTARSTRLPFWLRTPPKRPASARPRPTPRDIRWWAGIVWFLLAALLLGLVAHVTIIGVLQHMRSQYLLYDQLRADLAEAVVPLGQLGFDGAIVPNGTPIALLSIPKLGISEVVVQGTRPTDLTGGPGHRRDTVYPGQAGTSIIMARQTTYGGPFARLGSLVPGDVIEVTTGQGTHRYQVFGVRRDGDLLPQALSSGAGRLELVTADGLPLAPSGSLYVDASLESPVQTTPAPVFTKEVLAPSEFALAADSGAWFPTLFWLQWLAIGAVALRWARTRWGVWQTWIVGVPLILGLGAATANAAIGTLANLL